MEFKKVRLGEVCTVNQGLQIPISKRFKEKAPNRYFYITIQFLKGKTEEYYIENPKKSVLCKKEDILVVRTGSTGIVLTNVEGCFHNNFFKVEPNEKIYRKYLYYALNNQYMYKKMLNAASGTTIPDLKHSAFYDLQIPLPEMDEQYRIVNILENIDKKIQLNNQINDNLYNILNSLFKNWFEDYNRFDNEEFKTTEIGNIPNSFDLIELNELISIRGGFAYKASKLSENKEDNILISMGNVELNNLFNFNNLKYYSENVDDKFIANAGDLFICTRDVTQQRNQLGCPGIVPKIFKDRNVIIGTNLYIVEYKKYEQILSKYLFLLLNSLRYRERIVGSAKGTAILMIAKEDILKFKFAFPKDEKILNEFNEIVKPIFDKIENNVCENEKLSKLRDTLLPKLMNGDIDLEKIEI